MATHTIQLDEKSQRFYKGVDAARQVNEAHAGVKFPSVQAQRDVFWFYVGGLAVEAGLTEPDEFADFMLGAGLNAPRESEEV